jgi:ribosomal protein L40E
VIVGGWVCSSCEAVNGELAKTCSNCHRTIRLDPPKDYEPLKFTGQTSGPVPVSDVCASAKELDTVCIVGLKDGKISVRYSENGNIYEAIGILERGKKHLLSVLEED